MFHIKEHYGELARSAGNGDPHSKAELAKQASKQHLKPIDRHLRAHREPPDPGGDQPRDRATGAPEGCNPETAG